MAFYSTNPLFELMPKVTKLFISHSDSSKTLGALDLWAEGLAIWQKGWLGRCPLHSPTRTC